MKLFLSAVLGVFILMHSCFAQQNAEQVFTLQDFIQQVKKYHPLAKKADLQVDKALAELLVAKGSFDPAVELDASRKTLDGKNYYYYTNPQLSIPLPVGNVLTGIEHNGGDYLTSEVTKGKSSYAGIELPLAKGLLLDKRRALLQQAKILRSQSEQERLLMFNNLLFEACTDYWQWAASHQQYLAYAKFEAVAANRMRLVRIAFVNGDRAIADTIEAFTQLQQYQLMRAEALLKLQNAKLELANHLWLEGYASYQLPENYLPENLDPLNSSAYQNAEDLLLLSTAQNPVLKLYNYKLSSLEVERKLKAQSLLPYFSVKANLLSKDYYAFKNAGLGYLQNNYKWGVNFKIPLFLREARGDYKKALLKIKETNLELMDKRTQTENKIRTYYNDYTATLSQLQVVKSMAASYQSLLRIEELKFAQGESSLFLVNSRETKLIEIVQKQIELSSKCYKARYAMEWAAGILK